MLFPVARLNCGKLCRDATDLQRSAPARRACSARVFLGGLRLAALQADALAAWDALALEDARRLEARGGTGVHHSQMQEGGDQGSMRPTTDSVDGGGQAPSSVMQQAGLTQVSRAVTAPPPLPRYNLRVHSDAPVLRRRLLESVRQTGLRRTHSR